MTELGRYPMSPSLRTIVGTPSCALLNLSAALSAQNSEKHARTTTGLEQFDNMDSWSERQ
jgi:hypothetical protein